MKKNLKMILFFWNLLIVLILPLKWYYWTKFDSTTYQALGHTGFAAFGEFGYAFTLIFIAYMIYYCYSLIKNIFMNLYLCDIVLIFTFTWFPYYRGWKLGQYDVQNYEFGYWIAIAILLMNLVGVIFYHRLTVGLRRVAEKKEV
jgi:hypothetical protein